MALVEATIVIGTGVVVAAVVAVLAAAFVLSIVSIQKRAK